jgi:polyribonucleotide nucleotidyltransferase
MLLEAKRKIIDIMNATLSRPRDDSKDSSPLIDKLEVPIIKRARFLGLGGFNLKKLTADTGSITLLHTHLVTVGN